MHGIVHKTLKEYAIDRTDEETWEEILERAGLEPTLYLPVSSYEDHEIQAILSAITSMASQDRRQIERDFGRALAPELLSTFSAHVRTDDFIAFLTALESIRGDVDEATTDASLPSLTTTRESTDDVHLAYRTHREPAYCGLARGMLEGLAEEFDAEVTVVKTACVHDDESACRYQLTR
ncbi:heme NO-binding domain-containing protein [Natronorubrum daqingense]|uniref:Haem-NO-binding n=1 Tax=Natronorubrum daqingense TaxID=588898 RepID=A0A1N7EV06_9EURY|nr:heme NO-binding domain-containing protein [Natronorubrum daqingense]APX97697.1 hypothetical protein BB347_14340 [Natronorubrum daqingense]SIR91948.1 Haem-NO-binding [Natronorubrum daqingense]